MSDISKRDPQDARPPTARVRARRRSRNRPKGRSVGFIVGHGLGALILTPFIYTAIATVLFGHRDGWTEAQGGETLAFFASFYAALFVAMGWGVVAATAPRTGAFTHWLVAVAAYLVLGCLLQVAVAGGGN